MSKWTESQVFDPIMPFVFSCFFSKNNLYIQYIRQESENNFIIINNKNFHTATLTHHIYLKT